MSKPIRFKAHRSPNHYYMVTLKHDKGLYTLKVLGTSIKEVIDLICYLEGCPERAIISVVRSR